MFLNLSQPQFKHVKSEMKVNLFDVFGAFIYLKFE